MELDLNTRLKLLNALENSIENAEELNNRNGRPARVKEIYEREIAEAKELKRILGSLK